MVKVNVEPDCGNAPKKLFLRDFMIAVANSDTSFILDSVTDDATWDVVGKETVKGKSAIENLLKDLLSHSAKEMTIATILSHGNGGSVNGTTWFTDGTSEGFCHVGLFTSHGKNAKLKEITSYIISEQR